jgi:hypothetical protein
MFPDSRPGAGPQIGLSWQFLQQERQEMAMFAAENLLLPIMTGCLPCSVARCQSKIQAAEQMMSAKLNDFQGRLSRCAARCQDKAQESLRSTPSEAQATKAQVGFPIVTAVSKTAATRYSGTKNCLIMSRGVVH